MHPLKPNIVAIGNVHHPAGQAAQMHSKGVEGQKRGSTDTVQHYNVVPSHSSSQTDSDRQQSQLLWLGLLQIQRVVVVHSHTHFLNVQPAGACHLTLLPCSAQVAHR